MIDDMVVRNLAPNTQDSYLQQVSLFAHFNKSPDQLSPEEIRNYQLYLADEKHAAVGTRIVAFPISVDFASRTPDFSYIGRQKVALVE